MNSRKSFVFNKKNFSFVLRYQKKLYLCIVKPIKTDGPTG